MHLYRYILYHVHRHTVPIIHPGHPAGNAAGQLIIEAVRQTGHLLHTEGFVTVRSHQGDRRTYLHTGYLRHVHHKLVHARESVRACRQ